MISSSHGQEAQEVIQPAPPDLSMRCAYCACFPAFACPRLLRKSPTRGELRASAVPKPALLASQGSHRCCDTEQSQQTIAHISVCRWFSPLGLDSQNSKCNCKRGSAPALLQRMFRDKLSTRLFASAPRKGLDALSGMRCSCPFLMILSWRHTSKQKKRGS